MKSSLKYFFTFTILHITSSIFCQLPNTDIWILDVNNEKEKITFSNPVNITNREGYDNQPVFSPDGTYLFFTSVREGVQSDIYKYDIATKQTTQFTKTPESEYSPTFMPDTNAISVVRVEKDSTQRLWKFPLAGGEPSLILKDIKNIGYHCWIAKDSLALFILPAPFTLQLVDINTEKTTVIDDSIGRCLQKIPYSKLLSYYKKTSDTTGYIKGFDLRHLTSIENMKGRKDAESKLKGLNRSEDFIWFLPSGSDAVLMAKKSTLYEIFTISNKMEFFELQDLSKFGINNIGRLVLSPDRKKIAIVCETKPITKKAKKH